MSNEGAFGDDHVHEPKLVLAFDTDDEGFARGVEVGTVYEDIARCVENADGCNWERTRTVHTNNAEMMMRIAESLGLAFSAEPLDDEWTDVTFKSGDAGFDTAKGEK